jgi:predicted DNA-binding protein
MKMNLYFLLKIDIFLFVIRSVLQMSDIMTSIRLSKELEEKINSLAERENITKSEIIKKALDKYFESYEQKVSPFELGKEFFGEYGSGNGDLSASYKKKVRTKIHDKMSH